MADAKTLPSAEIQARLIKGAAFLGGLWRSKERCPEEFTKTCSCDPPLKFCRARDRFLELAQELVSRGERTESSEDPTSKYWMITNMEIAEFDSLGLHVVIESDKLGRLTIDSGEAMESLASLQMGDVDRMSDHEKENVDKIKSFFSGKKVTMDEGTDEPNGSAGH